MNKSANEKAWKDLMKDLEARLSWLFSRNCQLQLNEVINTIELVKRHMPVQRTKGRKSK